MCSVDELHQVSCYYLYQDADARSRPVTVNRDKRGGSQKLLVEQPGGLAYG